MFRTIVTLFMVVSFIGCESSECKRMKACCAQFSDAEWVGESCGALTDRVSGARSCAKVTDALVIAAEERGEELPAECL